MSDDLRRRLRLLEDEYPGQPLVARQADLREINHLRAQLGLPLVDPQLREIGAAGGPAVEARPTPAAVVPDHSEARDIYRAYLRRTEELAPHRAYAERVARATAGTGQTPVRPLATLGTGGGPLLCDQCGRPIVLEGGQFHGVTADVAWRDGPRGDWTSWILGGMVVHVQSNGTLRIYHGYPGQNASHCCNAAGRDNEKARAEFESPMRPGVPDLLLAFFAHEFPGRTREQHFALLSAVVDVLYSYDPGVGINRPDPVGE